MRRVEPLLDQHRAGLFALHARIFGAAKAQRFRARFEWWYVDNPYRRAGQVTNWVMTSDGGVVGHLGAAPIDVKVGDQRLHGTWICDYMVDAPHRFGPELSTLRAAASHSSDFAMGYGMPDHVARSYVKLSWGRLAVGSSLVKCLRLRGVAGLLRGPRGGNPTERARLLLRFGRQLLGRSARPPGGAADLGLHGEWDESFDRLWDRVGTAYPVAVERNRRYLRWRYRLGGDDGARLIVLGAVGAPRGFALIEKVRWRGIVAGLITELIVAPDDARRLLGFAEEVLRREGVSAIVTEGFPARARTAFRQQGFIEPGVERENATFFDRLHHCQPALVDDVENWLLTPGDSDRSLGYPRVPWRNS